MSYEQEIDPFKLGKLLKCIDYLNLYLGHKFEEFLFEDRQDLESVMIGNLMNFSKRPYAEIYDIWKVIGKQQQSYYCEVCKTIIACNPKKQEYVNVVTHINVYIGSHIFKVDIDKTNYKENYFSCSETIIKNILE